MPPAEPDDTDEPDDAEHTDNRVMIGGRYGSPSIVVGLPLSDITVQERESADGCRGRRAGRAAGRPAEQVATLLAEPGDAGGPEPGAGEPDGEGAPARSADATDRAAVVEEVRSRALALQRRLLAADR
ncbi:MAG: hypothetical protein R2726_14800 [Acidimicrobiales bacterium]